MTSPIDLSKFTARQQEVAGHVVLGQTNDEIAAEMKVTPQTVKNHLHSIYHKTGIANRVTLAVEWDRATRNLEHDDSPGPSGQAGFVATQDGPDDPYEPRFGESG